MSKPIVAVTQRVDKILDRNELRDAVDQRLFQWLIYAGFLPVPIPNVLCCEAEEEIHKSVIKEWLHVVEPAALLLSGGNNIGSYPARDLTEYSLLSWAKVNKKPVLGICRGLQVMAQWSGSGLIPISGHVNSRHELIVPSESEDWPDTVNSFHGWSLTECPAEFVVAAFAQDRSIEAIKHSILPWEGWMWHPERESPFTDKDTKRLQNLFNA